jgi:hypothetical protein
MRRNRLFGPRTLVLGGLAAVAVAGALKNRRRVAGLIGARSSEPEPYQSPAPAAPSAAAPAGPAPGPEISNYDASGPPENTATPIPAPEPLVHQGGIDEEAEEAAAAAEAGAIGGAKPHYAGLEPGEQAPPEMAPLMEAGEGASEGEEQAEAELDDNAEAPAGDPLEGGRQIDDVIEEQGRPFSGETVDPEISHTPAAEKSANVWRGDDQPTEEAPPVPPPAEPKRDEDGGQWQTWSGRAVE